MQHRCMGCMELYDGQYDVCPYCGFVKGTPAEEPIHMNPGTVLQDRYYIGRVLGYGGFGVTYLGWDTILQQKVAVKEYLPSEFSTRMPDQTQVTIFNGDKQDQYRSGMEKFIDEASRLAKFQNEPGIVKIFDSFNENGTAYIIMEFLRGETLAEYLKRVDTIPEDEAVDMLRPIMESLKVVHGAGIIHRDISPDNIFITEDGSVKLLDFGASRYATTSHSRSLTVIVKPGYSPEEQYRSRGDQGPHTDVYALAATLYKMVTGKTPPDSMERRAKIETQKKDLIERPKKLNKKISAVRENAILNALNVQIEDRTPDVDQFLCDLDSDVPIKRVYGKIKKIDVYSWPIWLKILVPVMLSAIAAFAVLLAVGVIDVGSLFSGEVVVPDGIVIVPDVELMDNAEAITLLESNHINIVTAGSVRSDYISAGKIVLQSPVGGSYIEEYGIVYLTVSSGGEIVEAVNGVSTVPYIIWDDINTAKEKLAAAGLGEPILEEQYDENVAEGQVISQSLAAGEQVETGTVITVVVSKGPAPVPMPDVMDQLRDSAYGILSEMGLVVHEEYAMSETYSVNHVMAQSTAPGTMVKKGDTVSITVCSGKATFEVPNVVGYRSADAGSTLRNAGFDAYVIENYDDHVAAGLVISQSPGGGSRQVKGTAVTIYVSKGTNMVSVPDALGLDAETAAAVIQNAGFTVGTTDVYSDTVPSGYVVSQSPMGGSMLRPGSKVGINISKGKQPVPVNVYFDANGGSVSQSSAQYWAGSSYGNMPTPQRDYYTFNGWLGPAGYVDSGSVVTLTYDHTLTAQWTEKPVSGWVKEDQVPGGAQIVNTKWTYDKRSTTTSDSKISGWNVYDSYTEYGPEQTSYSDPSNGERKVWTSKEEYQTGSTHHWVYYHVYKPGTAGGDWGTDWSLHSGERHSVDLTYELRYWSVFSYNGNSANIYLGGQICPNGCSSGCAWYLDYEYDQPIYSERTVYHYREPVYVYYLEKWEYNQESFSYPSGDVSNVVTWVQYRER